MKMKGRALSRRGGAGKTMKHKRVIAGAVAAALTLWAPAGAVFAATSSSTSTATAKTTAKYTLSHKSIYWNGKQVSNPYGFAANQTTYMPVWYVMHTLDAMQITNTWNGSAWNITTPKGMAVDLSKMNVGTGNISIYLNGTLIKKIDSIAYVDPSSGNPTTYMPVWYVMGILERLYIHSDWDGTSWKMTPNPPATGTTPPPPPPPPAPVDTTPQAAQFPGAVSQGQLISDFATALKLPTASVAATSPYDDVPVTSPQWVGLDAAVLAGLATPFSATHFGAGDVVTLQDAEQFYWNYLNISPAHTQYEPGITLDNWASLTGLNQGVLAAAGSAGTAGAAGYLTLSDEQQLIQNLDNLEAGMAINGNIINVRYTPKDEYNWTFDGDVTSSWAPIYTAFSSPTIQEVITRTYAFYDAIQIQLEGDAMVVTLPIDADKRWFAYARSQDGVQYSTNGGATWTSVGSFDGSTAPVSPSGTVMLKALIANGLSITYNNMVSAVNGSISLGWVNIDPNGTGGIRVQRVTLT